MPSLPESLPSSPQIKICLTPYIQIDLCWYSFLPSQIYIVFQPLTPLQFIWNGYKAEK